MGYASTEKQIRKTLKLTPVESFLVLHPELRNQDANHAICWSDTRETDYLVNPSDVDEHGWCKVFYYRHPLSSNLLTYARRHPKYPLVGLQLPLRAEEITEIEPGLFKLRFT